MKIHILGRNALNCALYLEFNVLVNKALKNNTISNKLENIETISYTYNI